MKGVLWKWTNYWSGWQMRWFVLDNGILSYYKSQDEVNQGCKGSLKVSACEIIAHSTDHTRLEISIPGEQHMYLKASSKQERQQWLVALGSSKACMTTRSRKEKLDQSNGDSLKSKRIELKVYCDLLMQQVHQMKTCANDSNGVDVNKLNEAASLLTVTCDTFITTLDDCMKLADANFLLELSHHPSDTPVPLGCHHKSKPTVPVMKRSSSYESSDIKSIDKKTIKQTD